MGKYPKEAKICCPRCEGNGYLTIKSTDFLIFGGRKTKKESRKLRNKLRRLNSENKLDNLSLRKIGSLVGLSSPQQVKHHILMLDKIGWDNFESED